MKCHKNRFIFEDVTNILTLRHLAFILGIKKQLLIDIAEKSENFYHPYCVIKTRRIIDKPVGKLKEIQTRINKRILALYKLVETTHGGVPGQSAISNAEYLLNQKVIVHLDLKHCFHNTKSIWVKNCFINQFGYSEKVALMLTKLSTYKCYVPVGSPLSTSLINIVYNRLWRKIRKFCISKDHKFEIWVDDISIAGKDAQQLIPGVKKIINNFGVKINWDKLKIQRNHKEAQIVTGCVVNKVLGVPIKKRRIFAKTAINSMIDSQNKIKSDGQITFTHSVNKKQGKQLAKLINKLNTPLNHQVY